MGRGNGESKVNSTPTPTPATPAATLAVWLDPTTEHLLLTDLLYIFQGIGGRYIRYDGRTESYLIDPTLKVNSTARDLVLSLCELGWLYGRVSGYLRGVLEEGGGGAGAGAGAGAGTGTVSGVVAQALAFSLQAELLDYLRLLAVLEQDLTASTYSGSTYSGSTYSGGGGMGPMVLTTAGGGGSGGISGGNGGGGNGSSNGINGSGGSGSGGGGRGSGSGLTLLRLRAWLQEPIERMIHMATIVDGARPLHGGALVSRLYSHSLHGDPATSLLVERVITAVCAPLYTMLARWVLYGELADPHREFFVFQNGGQNGRVLLIGKSINFIRLCLQQLPRVANADVG
ncbi:Spc98 family-domain-containing protein, partial [Ochromonadaceae sp. CCMP2298]